MDELAERIRHPTRKGGRTHPQAIVLGSSTGGPDALQDLLATIDQPLNVPMFIVQHMPAKFTRQLARRLDERVTSKVVEAEAGVEVRPGVCYVAPGGRHLKLRRLKSGAVVVVLNDDSPVKSCRPSVDLLFESAQQAYGAALVAVVLAGMGRDGADGAAGLAELGCPIIVQDRRSSVVWGMPGSVVQAELASEALPLKEIGPRLSSLAKAGWSPVGDTQRAHVSRDNP